MALDADALGAWATKQKALLSDAYDRAWHRGVQRYVPRREPDEDAPELPDRQERDNAGALARGHRAYVAPTVPDNDRKRLTLERPFQGVDKMVGELAAIQTTPSLAPGGPHASAGAATAAWAAGNLFRLATSAGSAVWGGEQTGFAAAAGVQDQLLIWDCAEDDTSCQDCLDMAEMGAMREQDWPFFPGTGGTVCGGNCRCSMDYAPAAEGAEAPALTGGGE